MILPDRACSGGFAMLVRQLRKSMTGVICGLLALVIATSAAFATESRHRAHAPVSSCAGRWPCDLGGSFVLTDFLRGHRPGSREVIAGVCYSRCTMALISGACVTPNAELGFHAVTNAGGNVDRVATATVESLYPLGIRRWIRETGAMSSLQITTLSGTEAMRLGVPACSPHAVSVKLR
jgi:hypothetical protein